jgi:hypothetical protein
MSRKQRSAVVELPRSDRIEDPSQLGSCVDLAGDARISHPMRGTVVVASG